MARPINDSKGCGGVMRVAPVAWITRESGSQEAFECASRAAALTHGHPSGYLSAGFLAALIRYLMDDKSIDEAIEGSMTILQKWPLHEEALRAVNHACDEARSRHGDHVASIHRLGGGWVGEEALAIAIYSVLSAKNAEEAVRIAANHSGDSDSTASIAGQIWGAKVGIRGIPHQWTCKLDVLDPLLHLAHESVGSITCNGRSDAEVAAGQ
jgi:ADP-ribosylglycohydrolase